MDIHDVRTKSSSLTCCDSTYEIFSQEHTSLNVTVCGLSSTETSELGMPQKLRKKRKFTKSVNFSSAKDIILLSAVIKKRSNTEYQ